MKWSAELQNGDGDYGSKHRRMMRCAVICGVASALITIAFIIAWCQYDDEDGLAGMAERFKGDDFTTADWERVIVDSGPLSYGWEKEAV